MTARAMEAKWSVDGLMLLVSVDMREKADRQKFLINKAIWHGELEDIRQQSKTMIAAWRALDRQATEKGAEGFSPQVCKVRPT